MRFRLESVVAVQFEEKLVGKAKRQLASGVEMFIGVCIKCDRTAGKYVR